MQRIVVGRLHRRDNLRESLQNRVVFKPGSHPSCPRPAEFLELIGIFERHADEYTSPDFEEVMLRQQVINPLFKSLGWDMENE
jgi:hypothetical protein